MAGSVKFTVSAEGVRDVLAAFRDLPKEASDSLRERTLELSQLLAGRVQSRMRSDSRQSALVAQTVKAKKDRIPSISIGGAKRVGSKRTPAYKIMFGAEFGSNSLRQFRSHRGQQGYAIFPAIDDSKSEILQAWANVVEDIVKAFNESGSGE